MTPTGDSGADPDDLDPRTGQGPPDTSTTPAAVGEQKRLYAAYCTGYAKEANRRVLLFAVDASIALGGLGLALAARDGSALGVVGVGWLLVREIPFFVDPDPWRKTAATIQEQFDLSFSRPDWTSIWNQLRCGPPVRDHEVRKLAAAHNGPELAHDYWVDTTGLPPNTAALLRVLQCAAWGTECHRRYSRINYAAVGLAILGLVLAALRLDLTTWEALATVAVPCVPFLLGRLQAARRHSDLAQRRGDLYDHITGTLEQVTTDAGTASVRAAQDALYDLRLAHSRIPPQLFNRYRDKDQAAIDTSIQTTADRRRQQLNQGRAPGPATSPVDHNLG